MLHNDTKIWNMFKKKVRSIKYRMIMSNISNQSQRKKIKKRNISSGYSYESQRIMLHI